ncbi:MAG: twin-arginine translocase subunit TatC [Bacteroidia bacterium]
MALDQEKNQPVEETEMSFFDHIDALRGHLFRSALAILIFGVTAFVNKHLLFDIIIFGPTKIDFITYRAFCKFSYFIAGNDQYCIKDMGFTLKNITMSGQFTQHIFVAFIAGLVLAFPYIIFELWRFVKPALSTKEKTYAKGVVFFVSILFFIGVLFGYFLLAPLSVNFLGSYRVSDAVSNEVNIESYISFVSTLTLATGLVFELPMLVYFLTKIGLITSKWMGKNRKYAIVVILLLAGILTPSPDVASQIMMFIPLYGLYEISIYVAKSVEKNKT